MSDILSEKQSVKKILENSRYPISRLYNVNDESVTAALAALDHAIEIYGNSEICNTPERILLTDHQGSIVHTVNINGGFFDTVKIKPKVNNKFFLTGLILGLSVITLIIGYISITKLNFN